MFGTQTCWCVCFWRLSTPPRGVIVLSDEEDSTEGATEQRLARLQELFPHIDRKELLEVKSSSQLQFIIT